MRIPIKRIVIIFIFTVFISILIQYFFAAKYDNQGSIIPNVDSFKEKVKDVLFNDQTEGLSADRNIEATAEQFDADIKSLSSIEVYPLILSINSLLYALLVTCFMSFLYLYKINSNELIYYVNRSLTLAGFNARLSLFGRKLYLNNGIKVKISGMKKLEFTIVLPVFKDYLFYGLTIKNNQVITKTNIDNLPLKLLTVGQYIKNNKN